MDQKIIIHRSIFMLEVEMVSIRTSSEHFEILVGIQKHRVDIITWEKTSFFLNINCYSRITNHKKYIHTYHPMDYMGLEQKHQIYLLNMLRHKEY